MGLSYLNNKCWAEVTREERFFCAHLYGLIKAHGTQHLGAALLQLALPDHFNKSVAERMARDTSCEIGLEVCFYRDLPFRQPRKGRRPQQTQRAEKNTIEDTIRMFQDSITQSSPNEMTPPTYKGFLKRTFDLCLFFDDELVIIEAKSQQRFDEKQMNSFRYDMALIPEVSRALGLAIKQVHLVALTSSRCARPDNIARDFKSGGWITWQSLASGFNQDRILAHADLTYGAGSNIQTEDAP